MKKAILFILLGFPIFSKASMAYVYCGALDGRNWYWLKDETGNYRTTTGEWKSYVIHDGVMRDYFVINPTTAATLSGLCPKEFVPQPADSGMSGWTTFIIKFPNGNLIPLAGYVSRALDDRPRM